jgi:hypothetical protein
MGDGGVIVRPIKKRCPDSRTALPDWSRNVRSLIERPLSGNLTNQRERPLLAETNGMVAPF